MKREEYLRYGLVTGLLKFSEYFELTKPLNLPDWLEEAAKGYAEKHGFRVPYDGSNNFYDDVDVKASKDGFIAGAEWGMNQCPLPEDTTIFLKGVAEGKRLMMDEAVEGTIVCYPDKTYSVESCLFNNKKHHKSGDKVKVIVIKED